MHEYLALPKVVGSLAKFSISPDGRWLGLWSTDGRIECSYMWDLKMIELDTQEPLWKIYVPIVSFPFRIHDRAERSPTFEFQGTQTEPVINPKSLHTLVMPSLSRIKKAAQCISSNKEKGSRLYMSEMTLSLRPLRRA
jgi:hypothetical protein